MLEKKDRVPSYRLTLASKQRVIFAPQESASRIESDRKSTRLNSSHGYISYAVFCLKKKKKRYNPPQLHSSTTASRSRQSQVTRRSLRELIPPASHRPQHLPRPESSTPTLWISSRV